MATAHQPKERKALTAADVIGKVQKMLDQLDEDSRKRVLAFFNA